MAVIVSHFDGIVSPFSLGIIVGALVSQEFRSCYTRFFCGGIFTSVESKKWRGYIF